MAQIRWTEEAAAWLEDIYKYIAQDSAEAAANVVAGIYQKAQVLADFPAIGHLYREVPQGQIRVLLYGHYRIAYMVEATGDTVVILGVFHGSLDIGQYL